MKKMKKHLRVKFLVKLLVFFKKLLMLPKRHAKSHRGV